MPLPFIDARLFIVARRYFDYRRFRSIALIFHAPLIIFLCFIRC